MEIVKSVLGIWVGDLSKNGAARIHWQQNGVTVIHATHTGEDGFDVVVEATDAPALWDSLIEAGARPVGQQALNVLRIEAGLPRYGRDMNETNVISEANLDDAISFTKGCYIGQEIIARIKYRGHVAKKLTGLLFETSDTMDAGAIINSVDNKEIGRVTSAVRSPKLERTVALGYLRYEHLIPGTVVHVNSGKHQFAATVTDLPFVKGSWYDLP